MLHRHRPRHGRRRYRTATVRGNRADAERGLADLVAAVRADRAVGVRSTLSGAARGVVRDRAAVVGADHGPPDPIRARPLPPPAPRRPRRRRGHAGDDRRHLRDAARTRRQSAADRCRPGRSPASTSCCARRSRRRSDGDGCGTTQPSAPTASSPPTPSCTRRRRPSCARLLPTSRPSIRCSTSSCCLAATTGARRAQLLGLRWDNVHRDTMPGLVLRRLGRRTRRPGARRPRRPSAVTSSTSIRARSPCSLTMPSARGTRRRRVRVQRRRGSDRVEAEPSHQGLRAPSPRRRAPSVPAPRPPPLHGHRDAPRRHPAPGRLPPTRPPTRLDHAQQVRPRRSRRRRTRLGHPAPQACSQRAERERAVCLLTALLRASAAAPFSRRVAAAGIQEPGPSQRASRAGSRGRRQVSTARRRRDGEVRGSVRLSFVGTVGGYGTMASILVVGGGMGGLSTAMLLARDGHEVTVLERDPAPPPASGDEAWDTLGAEGGQPVPHDPLLPAALP